ncbi:hypothetical protein FRC0547_00865 [Corynebacterium diphtheriae]|nr:hypothetical protein FRC0515_00806 [Corynebacterium diphtheriae]CAB1035220.1 hypothetical protein FRC0547_00865 [Corynebacterium diphtheriae]
MVAVHTGVEGHDLELVDTVKNFIYGVVHWFYFLVGASTFVGAFSIAHVAGGLKFWAMDVPALISAIAAAVGAIASIAGGLYAHNQANEAKIHAERASRAAESVAKTQGIMLALEQKRLFLEPLNGNKVRIHNPGIRDIDRIDIASDQIPNRYTSLRTIGVGEHADIELVPKIPQWGLMYFTVTVYLLDGTSLKMEYSGADIRAQWRDE